MRRRGRDSNPRHGTPRPYSRGALSHSNTSPATGCSWACLRNCEADWLTAPANARPISAPTPLGRATPGLAINRRDRASDDRPEVYQKTRPASAWLRPQPTRRIAMSTTRRSILAAAPIATTPGIAATAADAELLSLGEQLAIA